MEKQRWEKSEKRREEKKREDQKKEDAGAWKVRKVAKHCVFPMFCGSGGSKSRLAKAADAEPCGQMRDEKLHAVVARSTFPSQNAKGTSTSEHFWKLRCRKSAHRSAWMYKTPQCWNAFGSWAVKKAHAEVKMYKTHQVRNTFLKLGCGFVWQAQGIVHLVKCEWDVGFSSSCNNDGRHATFQEDLQRCISRGRRRTRDMFIRDVSRSGRWFPERGCILVHHTVRFAKMVLRDRCSISYDLASFFRGRGSTVDRWSGKIAKRSGTRPSSLHSAN